MNEKNSINSLHYRYMIFMLLAATVFLMTDRWTGKGDFTQYLSNAATMTSLLLGVIAIFYSFISNNTMSSSLGSISEVSKDVREVGDQIAEYHENSASLMTAGQKSTAAMENFSKHISSNLTEFHALLKDMDTKNIAMRDMMASMPTKMDQLEEKFNKVSSLMQKQKPDSTTTSNGSDWNLKRFTKRSNPSENLITYACILHAEAEKLFNLDKVTKVLNISGYSNMNHFIRCLDSVGYITLVTVHSQPHDIYKVTNNKQRATSALFESEMSSKFEEYTERGIHLKELIANLKEYVTNEAEPI